MGVYIKGMEMPTSCYKCPLRRRNGMDIVCPVAHERFSVADVNILEYRLNSCPLVEIPPHYDLIDHNALKISVMDCDAETRIDFLKHAMDCINKAPVVIPSDMPTYEVEEGET